MTKKAIFAIITLFIILSSCSAKHEGWQTLQLKNGRTDEKVGSLSIPGEWQCTYEDGFIYILDESGEPLMIEVDTEAFYDEKGTSDKFHNSYKFIDDNEDSEGFSNSALFGTVKVLYEGEERELLLLSLSYSSEKAFGGIGYIEFLVWDSEINRDMLKDIAKTYTMTLLTK